MTRTQAGAELRPLMATTNVIAGAAAPHRRGGRHPYISHLEHVVERKRLARFFGGRPLDEQPLVPDVLSPRVAAAGRHGLSRAR